MADPILPSSDGRARTALLFAAGLVLTVAAVVGLVAVWPSGDDGDETRTADTTATTEDLAGPGPTGSPSTLGEPSDRTSTTVGTAPPPSRPANLFRTGTSGALADMVAAAGRPREAFQISVYPGYAFLAYRDPANPSHIDRRSWRAGADQDDAGPNPISDRVDADTTPKLFPIADVDLRIIPRLIDDAVGRFDLDVAATHVIIDRFLPFDERVLIRVYASPTDGRSGGGYVQYTLRGDFVKVVG